MGRGRLVLLFGLLPGALPAQQNAMLVLPAVQEITLDEAIARADRVQPNVVQARANIRNANANKMVALGAWLPSLTASSSLGYLFSGGQNRVDPVTGQIIEANQESQTINAGLSTNWDIFTGFRRGADSRAARAGLDAAEAGFLNTSFQQRLTTTTQFFTALGARQIVEVRRSTVKRAEEQLNAAVTRLHAGTATRSDSLRSLVTLGNSQVALAQSLADLAAAEAGLARLIGSPGRVRAIDDSTFYRPVVELDSTVLAAEAKSLSPQVQNTRAVMEQAEAQLKSSKSTYFPQVSLGASWSYNGNSQNDFDLNNQRQAQVSLNWPIFNRFTRERNVELQKSNFEVAQASAADAERLVESAITGQLAQLEAARLQIDIAQQSLLAAQEDLRVIGERYRLGVAVLVDVLVSQEALTQAELDAVTSRYNYLGAKAQIEAIIGRPL